MELNFTKNYKLLLFGLLILILFTTLSILASVNRINNSKALQKSSQASELNITADETTADNGEIGDGIITTPSGCRYSLLLGEGFLPPGNRIVCTEKCTWERESAGLCRKPYTCYFTSIIKCLDDGQEHRIRGGCQKEKYWREYGGAVCCADIALEYAKGAGFGVEDKQMCDLICQRAGQGYCELDQQVDNPSNPTWRCPFPSPTFILPLDRP